MTAAMTAALVKDEVFVRLVTSYATLPSDVDGFLTLAMTAGRERICYR